MHNLLCLLVLNLYKAVFYRLIYALKYAPNVTEGAHLTVHITTTNTGGALLLLLTYIAGVCSVYRVHWFFVSCIIVNVLGIN